MHSEIAESSSICTPTRSFSGPVALCRRVAALILIVDFSLGVCCLLQGDLTVVILPLSLQATVVAAFGLGGCRMVDARCKT